MQRPPSLPLVPLDATFLVGLLLVLHAGVLIVLAINIASLTRSRTRRTPLPSGMKVSVLVPARNEEENLRRLLPTLLSQEGVELEIIVVDDASEDGTWDVLQQHADPRLKPVRGSGPPAGWVGKPHALYQAAQHATGDVYVFLDADAECRQPDAVRSLAEKWQSAGGPNTAITGLPYYLDRGPAALLTSLVPFAIMAALPIPLVPRTKSSAISALNGQFWMIGAEDYKRLAPHEAVKNEVLEDVMIGRYLKREGVRLHFIDLQTELAVRMYRTFGEAWQGFRKNAYLLAGDGRPLPFLVFFAFYALYWVLPTALAFAHPLGWMTLATLALVKLCIDRWERFPLWVSVFGPVTLALGATLQLDSAWAHLRGQVAWKGRNVG
ncbi:MAG: glycosyltransferase family 2 protein [Bacteroidota bacterium]